MLPLRNRILLTLAGAAIALLGTTYAIERATLMPSFLDLEREQAFANLERGTAALQNEVSFVNDFAGDWSAWDDTYKFVTDHNADYYKSNLETNAFRPDSFDFLSFVNKDGDEVWRGCEVDGSRRNIDELPRGKWRLDHVLLQPRTAADSRLGILMTRYGPLLLASRAISDSERKAPANGWLVMGRFLTPAREAKLAKQTDLQLVITPMAEAAEVTSPDQLRRLADGPGRDVELIDNQHLAVTARVPGLTSPRDDLLVRVDLPRLIFAQGRATIGYTLGATCLAVVLLFATLWWLLQRSVVDPLLHLRDHALAIRASDDLTRRCGMVRGDEIGTLAQEFDRMVARLAASQSQLLGDAREGGMAEVARSVLHDVGNALQTVTTSAGLLRQKLGGQSIEDLERISEMLAGHAADLEQWLTSDPKGRQVPTFLNMLAGNLQEDHGVMQQELSQLTAGLDHIQHLIEQQSGHADKPGAVEAITVAELLEEAVRLSAIESDGVTVECDHADAQVRTEKHRVLAVLVNLLRNASHSVRKVDASRRTIRIWTTPINNGLRLTVADDGVGISPDDLARIFRVGYSTKAGSNGRGLHGCANSARELGGNLSAESEGPDRGASFHLDLPARPALVEASV